DLINRLEADALAEVKSRHPDLDARAQQETAHAIAVGALRYFLLKFTRNSVIAFDFKEALSFEGETGPYCQYAAVRANSIFRKLGNESDALTRAKQIITERKDEVSAILEGETGNEIWSMLMLAARLDESNG